MEVKFHASLTTSQDGGEWLVSRSGCIRPGKRAPCVYLRKFNGPQSLSVHSSVEEKIVAENRTLVFHSVTGNLNEVIPAYNSKNVIRIITFSSNSTLIKIQASLSGPVQSLASTLFILLAVVSYVYNVTL